MKPEPTNGRPADRTSNGRPTPEPTPAGATPVIALADMGPAVPAWAARLIVALICAGVPVVHAVDGGPVSFVGLLGVVAAAAALSPSSAAPAALAGAAVLGLVIVSPGADDPLRPEVLATVFFVHLAHVACAVVTVLPAGAQLYLVALRRPALRFLAVQAGVFALAGLLALVPIGLNPTVLEVSAVLGITAITVLAVVLLRRR